MAIVVGEVLWAVGAIYSRGVKTKTPLTTFAAMQMVAGGGLLLAAGLLFGEAGKIHAGFFTPLSVLSLLFLIIFGSLVTFTAYTWLLQVSSPAIVSTHSYVNPLVAVFLGWALASEKVTLRTMLGAAIILGSVALTSVRKKREPVSEELASEACLLKEVTHRVVVPLGFAQHRPVCLDQHRLPEEHHPAKKGRHKPHRHARHGSRQRGNPVMH